MTSEVIYQDLKARIAGGEFEVGDPCPSENKLCDHYGVSRSVVRRALQKLMRDGLLDISQGRRSTFSHPLSLAKMRPQSSEDFASFGAHLQSLGRNPEDQILQNPVVSPLHDLAETRRFDVSDISDRLSLRSNQKVVWFCRLRLAEKRPLVLQWAILPFHLCGEISPGDLVPGGLTKTYREQFGIMRDHARAAYRPAAADGPEARALQIVRGDPLIEERRVSFAANENWPKSKSGGPLPYEYLLSLYTYRTELQFDWKDSPEP